MKRPYNAQQRQIDYNPAEPTAEESARLRRRLMADARWNGDDDFEQLPLETLAEYFAAREAHWREMEAFGPLFTHPTSDVWLLLNNLYPLRLKKPVQLALFD